MKQRLLRLAKKLTPFIWERLQTVDWSEAHSPATKAYERRIRTIGAGFLTVMGVYFVYAAAMIFVLQYPWWSWGLWAALAFIFYRFLWVKPRQFTWSIHTLIIDIVTIIITAFLAYEVSPGNWGARAFGTSFTDTQIRLFGFVFYLILIPTLIGSGLFSAFLSTIARPILLAMQVKNKSHEWKDQAKLTGRKLQRYYSGLIQKSQKGETTGYEPEFLEAVTIKPNELVHGTPGANQDQAELAFAKALQADGFLNKFASFWSNKYPDSRVQQGIQTAQDLDCVLVGKDRVYLIDVLNTLHNEKVDQAASKVKVAEAKVRESLAKQGIKLPVSSFVVQMPTADGKQKADLQLEVNGVPVLGVLQMLRLLSKDKGQIKGKDKRAGRVQFALRVLSQLLKK